MGGILRTDLPALRLSGEKTGKRHKTRGNQADDRVSCVEKPQIEANIFNAVKNVDTGKLLGWRDENGCHSFLDRL